MTVVSVSVGKNKPAAWWPQKNRPTNYATKMLVNNALPDVQQKYGALNMESPLTCLLLSDLHGAKRRTNSVGKNHESDQAPDSEDDRLPERPPRGQRVTLAI